VSHPSTSLAHVETEAYGRRACVQGFTTPFVSIYHFGASLKTMHAIGASRPPKHFSGEAITGPIPCRACLYSVSFATQMVPAAGNFTFPAKQTVTADRESLRSRLRMQTVSLSPCRAWFILVGALRGIQPGSRRRNEFRLQRDAWRDGGLHLP